MPAEASRAAGVTREGSKTSNGDGQRGWRGRRCERDAEPGGLNRPLRAHFGRKCNVSRDMGTGLYQKTVTERCGRGTGSAACGRVLPATPGRWIGAEASLSVTLRDHDRKLMTGRDAGQRSPPGMRSNDSDGRAKLVEARRKTDDRVAE